MVVQKRTDNPSVDEIGQEDTVITRENCIETFADRENCQCYRYFANRNNNNIIIFRLWNFIAPLIRLIMYRKHAIKKKKTFIHHNGW